jgi:hypothetical protein
MRNGIQNQWQIRNFELLDGISLPISIILIFNKDKDPPVGNWILFNGMSKVGEILPCLLSRSPGHFLCLLQNVTLPLDRAV